MWRSYVNWKTQNASKISRNDTGWLLSVKDGEIYIKRLESHQEANKSYFGGCMKIPVTCRNCDVRERNPFWCGYYDRYCECYEENKESVGRQLVRRDSAGLGVQDNTGLSAV